MVHRLRYLTFMCTLISFIVASPFESPAAEYAVRTEKSWLWGWAWGSESTVAVVDRSPVVTFYSRPAAFGSEINDPILGYVIPLSAFTVPCSTNASYVDVTNNSGCPKLCLSSDDRPTEAWIALVQRGKCEFVKKVREAQRLGAKAVVVGGDDPEISGLPDSLVNMYSQEDSSDVKIAATYIRYTDYMQLYTLIATSNTSHSGLRTLSLLITAEYSVWEWYSPIITFVIILLLPSALTFATLLIHRIRAARAAQRDRAPESIVHSLPCRIWTGTGWEKHEGDKNSDVVSDHVTSADVDLEEGAPTSDPVAGRQTSPKSSDNPSTSHPPLDQPWFDSQTECAICLSEFMKGDKVRVLPCHHIFHLHEVDEWLIQRKKLCPVCKADVTAPQRTVQSPQNPDIVDIRREPQLISRRTSDDTNERTPLLRNDSGGQR